MSEDNRPDIYSDPGDQRDEYAKALEDLRKAVEIDPDVANFLGGAALSDATRQAVESMAQPLEESRHLFDPPSHENWLTRSARALAQQYRIFDKRSPLPKAQHAPLSGDDLSAEANMYDNRSPARRMFDEIMDSDPEGEIRRLRSKALLGATTKSAKPKLFAQWESKHRNALAFLSVAVPLLLGLFATAFPGLVRVVLVAVYWPAIIVALWLLGEVVAWPRWCGRVVRTALALTACITSVFGSVALLDGFRHESRGVLADAPAIINWPPKIEFDKAQRTVVPWFRLDNTTDGTVQVVNISRSRFAPASDDPQAQAQVNASLKIQVTNAVLAPGGQPLPFAIPKGQSEPYIIHSPTASVSEWRLYLHGKEALYFYGQVMVTMSDGSKTGYPFCGFLIGIVATKMVC